MLDNVWYDKGSEGLTLLRIAVERSGRSQASIARALGVSRQALGQWLSGEHIPVLRRREQIALELKLPVQQLWPEPTLLKDYEFFEMAPGALDGTGEPA
jgi:transcriptional regulator with XRE-family HTH domain